MEFNLKTNIILATLIFISFLLIGHNIYTRQIDKMDETRARLEIERRKNEICARIRKIQLEMQKYKDRIPVGRDIPWIVSEITSIARRANLDIHIIEPRPIKKRRFHAILPVTLKVAGSYHQLGRFVSKLESSEKFIKVDEMKLQSLGSRILEKRPMIEPGDEARADLFTGRQVFNPAGEMLADITFIISTMYLVE